MEAAQEVLRLKEIALNTRKVILEALAEAGSGHPGGSLWAVELLVTLYFRIMKHDPKNPKWEERDRFFLSKGHAAPLLYAILAQAGYFPVEELMTLRKMGSRLQGHPNLELPGVEAPAGSDGVGPPLRGGPSLGAQHARKGARALLPNGDGAQREGEVRGRAMIRPR